MMISSFPGRKPAQMQPTFEKLIPPPGQSFRCFNRETLTLASRWHRHPELEIIYVEHGSGTRIVGDSISSYADHDLVLVGPNLPHRYASDDFRGQKLDLHPAVIIQFREDFLGREFFAAPEFDVVRMMFKAANRGLLFPRPFAVDMGHSLSRLITKSPSRRLIHFLDCLVQLAEVSEPEQLASPTFSIVSPDDLTESRAERICSYIAEHYRDPELTQQALARLAEMNVSAFSRFFREATGKTVTNYLMEMRISLACRMLIHTDVSVTEIYQCAGFGNSSSFNRQFHRLHQMSPRAYRQMYREAASESPD